jgi:transposase-like protein
MSSKELSYRFSTRADKAIPFDTRLIQKIVSEVEQGLPRKEACLTYGMAYSTLTRWLTTFGSGKGSYPRKRYFSMHKKREVIEAVLSGAMTKKEACLAYNVNKGTLNKWLVATRKEDAEFLTTNKAAMPSVLQSLSNKDLEKQLAEARLKIMALETLIDVAEEQFNIPIRKKPGAKQ